MYVIDLANVSILTYISALSSILLPILYTSNQTSYKETIPPPSQGTLSWFLLHPMFTQWIESSTPNLLWVTGVAGCGKSVLAKRLGDWLRNHNSISVHRISIFQFFCDGNIEAQSTVLGILQGLLHQLLSSYRYLFKYVQKLFEERGTRIAHEPTTLWEIILNCCRDPGIGTVIFIIDGIDQCGTTTLAKNFMKWIVHATTACPVSGGNRAVCPLKILITSRATIFFQNAFMSVPDQRLDMEAHTFDINSDIAIAIGDKMDEIQIFKSLPNAQRSEIEQYLVENSHGTFLWVSAILELLEDSLEGSKVTLHRMLKSLPKNLRDVYDKMLERIPEHYKLPAKRLLHLVLSAQRPLTVIDASIAFTVAEADGQESCMSYAPLKDTLHPNFEQLIKGYCGPMLRVIGQRIYLLHFTLREHLLTAESRNHLMVYSSRDYTALEEWNRTLANACMHYLLLPKRPKLEFDEHNPWKYRDHVGDFSSSESGNIRELPVEDEEDPASVTNAGDIDAKQPFFRYAAEFWPHHFREMHNKDDGMFHIAVDLCEVSTCKPLDWFSLYWILNRLFRLDVPQGLTSLMVAASVGLYTVAEHLLNHGAGMDARTDDEETVLHLVSDSKDTETLNFLSKTRNMEIKDRNGYTPLHVAVRSGAVSLAKLFLDYHGDIETERSSDRSRPLNTAASLNLTEMVQLLLEYNPVIDATTIGGDTPLHSSCICSIYPYRVNHEVPRLLLQKGTSLTARTKAGRQPLHLAIETSEAPLQSC